MSRDFSAQPITREEIRQMSPEEQRTTLAEMRRQVKERLNEAVETTFTNYRLEQELVPVIPFRTAPTSPEYPETPPLRAGIDQEEYVRRIFRSDPGIKELRTADGNIYTRK